MNKALEVRPAELLAHADDYAALQRAVALLEQPGLTIQIVNLIGAPIDTVVSRMPKWLKKRIQSATLAALRKSVSIVLLTMDDKPSKASTKTHKLATATTGAVGGFFGWLGLIPEIPVTTLLMMRAVADVARSEGLSLAEPQVQAACVEVFGLGGSSSRDDSADTGYYATRSLVAEVGKHTSRALVEAAAQRSAQSGFTGITSKEAGSVLAKIIEAVAARFGVVLTEKAAAQVVPVLGAVTGAALNTLFTDHYQAMARGHFTVMRLERVYGAANVKAVYESIRDSMALTAS